MVAAADLLQKVTVLTVDGEMRDYHIQDMNFGYRRSIFQNMDAVIISAMLRLTAGDRNSIKRKMNEFAQARQARQPLDLPSAGSTFRRPEGFYVGPMIEQLGLKGFSIGGAEISQKHAGFIVNRGGASAQDVLELIAYVQNLAHERFNVELNTEIKIVGEE